MISMKYRSVAACFVAAALSLTLAGQASAQVDPAKIATVNTAKVFNEMQETKDMKTKMESDQKNIAAQNTLKEDELKTAKQQRDQTKQDTPQYEQVNQDFMQKVMTFNVWQQMMKAKLEHDQKQQMKSLYDKIIAAVNELATQRGYDLVIAENHVDLPDVDSVNVDQLRGLIQQRNVLFMNGKVDITNDVIANMDLKYKAGAPK